jgi:ubiquinol-cytochrome c reductase cytochrome c subunit
MSRRLALLVLGVVAALLVALLMAPPNGASGRTGRAKHLDVSLINRGAALYASNCSQCHGVNGAGRSAPRPDRGVGNVAGIGPSLRGVGALAADFYLSTGYMPVQNAYDQPRRSRVLFSKHDLRALAAYVASLGPGLRPDAPLEIEWSVEGERGRVDARVVDLPFLDLERRRA